jgi:hypothetical protein
MVDDSPDDGLGDDVKHRADRTAKKDLGPAVQSDDDQRSGRVRRQEDDGRCPHADPDHRIAPRRHGAKRHGYAIWMATPVPSGAVNPPTKTATATPSSVPTSLPTVAWRVSPDCSWPTITPDIAAQTG